MDEIMKKQVGLFNQPRYFFFPNLEPRPPSISWAFWMLPLLLRTPSICPAIGAGSFFFRKSTTMVTTFWAVAAGRRGPGSWRGHVVARRTRAASRRARRRGGGTRSACSRRPGCPRRWWTRAGVMPTCWGWPGTGRGPWWRSWSSRSAYDPRCFSDGAFAVTAAVRFWLRMGYRITSGPELMPDQTTVYHLLKEIRPPVKEVV